MSTLEKAIGLLQEMPENKLGIAHECANPSLVKKDTDAFENAVIEKSSHKSTLEERQRGFQGLMSFAGTLPEDFDYKKELEEAREEKYARTAPYGKLQMPLAFEVFSCAHSSTASSQEASFWLSS